jgi:hypothetical protein
MESALYFPYMQVPETAWFTHVLLYWDSVATIVPGAVRYDDSVVSRYMRELHKLGLLDYVEPDEELSDRREVFAAAFLTLLEGRPEPAGDARTFRRIHADKVSWEVFGELAGRGLALRDPGGGQWWSVESSTAELYLGYLAGALCGRRSQGDVVAHPVSDTLGALAGFSALQASCAERLRALRCGVIPEALPAPAQGVPPEDIRRFKDGNAERLRRLRRHLDERLVDIAVLPDAEERELRAKLVAEEIGDDVGVLVEQMTKRRWPTVLLGLGGVVGAGMTAVAGALGAGTSVLPLSLAVGSGVLSLAGPGHRLAEILRDPHLDRRVPRAYAALAPR